MDVRLVYYLLLYEKYKVMTEKKKIYLTSMG